MYRMLVHLGREDLDRIIMIAADGSVVADATPLTGIISRALGVLGVRVAFSSLDYLQHEDGTAEPDTRSASGMWWKSHGDDTSDVGGFILEGMALSLTHEGISESPLVEDEVIIERATKAIASQHESADVLGPGLFRLATPSGGRQVRLFVTRDHRLRRPDDLLEGEDVNALSREEIGLVVVQMIGGGKALVVSQGL